MSDHPASRQIARALLQWYDADKRELPWRRTRDPYRVWVSEVMLQQTQVQTVIPYFQRWMKSFPTVQALARAPLSRVLKHWEGLGYYSRARNLHRAAGVVCDQWRGRLPDRLEDLRSLPGIGRYTAGAILSIAFDRPAPVLDGNVKRVLSRLFCLPENGAGAASEKRLWETARSLVPRTRPGDFNQGLMELGATLCLPRGPVCGNCPLRRICRAALEGRQDEFPPPRPRTPSKKIEVSAAVIQRYGKVFIQQRPLDRMMGGLWEFPGGKLEPGESPEEALAREIREELGVLVKIQEKLHTIRHTYTRFRVTLHVFRCTLRRGRLRPRQCADWRWTHPADLTRFAFPAANLKIVEQLSGSRPPARRED